MSTGLLNENQGADLQHTLPIYDAFDREVPEHLQTAGQQATAALDKLDGLINQLEALAKQNKAPAAVQKAAEYRAAFQKLQKKALQEIPKSGKEPSKDLAKVMEELGQCDTQITAEMDVPIREAGVAKALTALKGRAKGPSASKVAAFEKQQQEIAKEKDPAARCAKYFKLERSIIQADLMGREADDPGSTWQDQVDLALQDAKPLGLADKAGRGVKSLAAKITGSNNEVLSDQDFLALKTAFQNSYSRRIDDMADAVPQASEAEFKAKAKATVTALADQYFAVGRKPADRQLLGKLLMQANTAALQQLSALKRQYPANTTPQVSVQDGKIVIAKAAPKVESLVLQGGGGKGAGYPPMLEEMQKAGILKDVNLLVGTSIGALNASCLACGGLADERQILQMSVMKEGFDAGDFKKKYPGVTFENPSPWIENPKKKLLKKVSNALPSCAGQMAKIDALTASSVANQLKGYSEDELATQLTVKLSKLDDDALAKMGLAGATTDVIEQQVQKLAKKVKNQDFGASDRTTQMITFKDLAMLHQLDPANFKELTITGWEGTGADGHEVYFNSKDFADMPVALAARISMGLPVFAPVYWEGRGPFFDGGLGSNAPVEATPGLDDFYKGKDPADAEEQLKGDVPLEVQQAMAKTMLMTFDDEGKGDRNLFGEGRKNAAPSGGEKVTVIGSGIQPKYVGTLTDDATKAYNGGVNTLEVYHGNLGTLALGPLASAEATEYAENMSRMKGLEQLDQRSDQAVALTCTSTDEALLGLSDDDKRSLVAAGKPEGGDPLVLELYTKCQQYIALDDAFQAVKGGGDATGFLDQVAASPLCASAAGAIGPLRSAYQVLAKGQATAEKLDVAIKIAQKALAGCPAYLRPMLKEAVLLPLQQQKRGLAKSADGPAATFLWQQSFSSQAFANSMSVAAQNKVLLFLPEAKAAGDALASFEKLSAELATKKKPKEACEAARKALNALEGFVLKLRGMGKVPSYAVIPTLLAYIDWLQDKAAGQRDRLLAIVKGKDAAFTAQPFVAWDKKDWERKAQQAVEAGAVEDPGSSTFGGQMEAAVKASGTWNQAGADAKEKASKAAWNTWDKLMRTAQAIQRMTDNKNFSTYVGECVTKATQERDRFQAP
jgi:predicted acylesterase/phospholipase RssA